MPLLPPRLLSLHARHAERHLKLAWRCKRFSGPGGLRITGAWECGGTLHVSGETLAPFLALRWNGADHRHPVRPDGTFDLAVPVQDFPLRIVAGEDVCDLKSTGAVSRLAARSRHTAGFLRDVARVAPAVLRWWWAGGTDPVAVAAIRGSLSLRHVPEGGPIDPARFMPAAPWPGPVSRPVTVIVPVYNAFHLLPAVLDRIERNADLPIHLVVVEDASTDPAVLPWLRAWARGRAGAVTLLENSVNAGFVHSVNRGLAEAAASATHAVLINSDALVPPGWTSRLMRPILDRPGLVASVTPFSNAANVLSVPVLGGAVMLRPGDAERLDRLAETTFGGASPPALPTGHGFCMAMNASFLALVPRFDPAFGRGYGEEVDWCRRTTRRGGIHVAQPGLLVEHHGSVSFGPGERLRLVQANAGLLRRRYPGYEAEVQRFARRDPLRTERLALAVAWAVCENEGAQVPVYVAHSLGGGAEHDLRRRLADHSAAIVLRVGGRHRWQLAVHGGSGETLGETDDFTLVKRLLTPLRRRHLIYACAVGDSDPVSLPDTLLSLLSGESDRLDFLVHDYFAISPSFTLLDSAGRYRGVPPPDDADSAHVARGSGGRAVPLSEWRSAWGRLLAASGSVTVFSPSSGALMREAYPAIADRLRLDRPRAAHEMPRCPDVLPGGNAVGLLGNLRLHKGARVAAALPGLLPGRRVVILGHLDPAVRPPARLHVHGPYAPHQIPELAIVYGIGAWVIPSVWPETYGFTVHEALATGLPVIGFDLGGQGGALRAAPNGHVVPLEAGAAAIATVLRRVLP